MNAENETRKHIIMVCKYVNMFAAEMLKRAYAHDASKLEEPEKAIFDKYTPLLAGVSFGSEEYKSHIKEMKVAIEHHHSKNKHHPEYNDINGYSFQTLNDPIRAMDLFDIVEMVCDWLAASKRHTDGSIGKSVAICAEKYHMDEQLVAVIRNTLQILKDRDGKA